MNELKAGAQLYTVRQLTQTIEGVAETLARVREMGYTGVQISAFGDVDPKAVARLVEENGLTVAATHMGWPLFLEDLDRVIEIHQLWGCRHTAIGGVPKDYYCLEGVDRFVSELAPIAEKLNAAGLDFSYHNHSHELVRYGGRTWLERLYSKASPDVLKAELDLYWLVAGGGDPVQWILDLGARQPVSHFKDMEVLPDRTQRFTEVGEGNLNWPKIVEACRSVGMEWALVEQDQCYDKDPFDCLATSYRNMREMGIS
jgi:sugar phosphate isomerase/epimerase